MSKKRFSFNSKETLYHGEITERGNKVVWVRSGYDARQLAPRLDLRNHSPTGFEWGYPGSGPAQLALALLADALNERDALALHQTFKFQFVANLNREAEWLISKRALIALVKPLLSTMREREVEARLS